MMRRIRRLALGGKMHRTRLPNRPASTPYSLSASATSSRRCVTRNRTRSSAQHLGRQRARSVRAWLGIRTRFANRCVAACSGMGSADSQRPTATRRSGRASRLTRPSTFISIWLRSTRPTSSPLTITVTASRPLAISRHTTVAARRGPSSSTGSKPIRCT